MDPGAASRQLEPRDLRRITPGASARGLPFDLIETGVKRLGFLGLVVALMAPSAFLIERLTQAERVAPIAFPFSQAAAALLCVGGIAIFALARSGKLPAETMLDLGLIFQTLVAFGIAVSEHSTAWPADHPIRGISWNCLWIVVYMVAIPGSYGKSVLAALAAASMAPFGLLVASAVNRTPLPTPNQTLVLLLPPFVAAAWAIPVARYLYRLGAQVRKARELGSYELLEPIGRGGMGEVWKAKHRMLARVSAVKLIRPDALGVESLENAQVLVRRFEREACATAALRSPHTVVLYDYGVTGDGRLYYAMELLEGIDLDALVTRFGPQPAGRVVHLLKQAAKSLAEAHDSGLVHRDIKPRNIFTCCLGADCDFVKVLDFGLVKVRLEEEGGTALTRAGVTAGTPAYMAPEIAAGNAEIDGRADLYSLGCVGYWLLTGRLVFDRPSAMAMALAHIQAPPVPPSRTTELRIPASVESAVLKCLEKDPARRFQTAHELVALLEACEDVEPWTRAAAAEWWRLHMPQREPAPAASASATTS